MRHGVSRQRSEAEWMWIGCPCFEVAVSCVSRRRARQVVQTVHTPVHAPHLYSMSAEPPTPVQLSLLHAKYVLVLWCAACAQLLTQAAPRGPASLPPDPGAVLALACHVVMVQAGFQVMHA